MHRWPWRSRAFVSATLETTTATIEMKLSFLVKLGNEYLIEGTAGEIRASHKRLQPDRDTVERGRLADGVGDDPADRVVVARRIIGNFLEAVEGKAALLIDAASAVRPLVVIDALYRPPT